MVHLTMIQSQFFTIAERLGTYYLTVDECKTFGIPCQIFTFLTRCSLSLHFVSARRRLWCQYTVFDDYILRVLKGIFSFQLYLGKVQ